MTTTVYSELSPLEVLANAMRSHQVKLDENVRKVEDGFVTIPAGMKGQDVQEWKEAHQDFLDATLADAWARTSPAQKFA